jgi:hypothetical protein
LVTGVAAKAETQKNEKISIRESRRRNLIEKGTPVLLN